jgi:hypothetical protein
MKHHVSACIVFLLMILTSCVVHQNTNNQDPTPKYNVVCRFTGADLAGLGAQIDTYIKPEGQTEFHVATYGAPDNGQVEYTSIGSPPDGAEFTVLVSFREVTRSGSKRPRATSKLTVEILVNGKVKNTLILDNNAQFGGVDYLNTFSKFTIGL